MVKLKWVIIAGLFVLSFIPFFSYAQSESDAPIDYQEDYFRAEVLQVGEPQHNTGGLYESYSLPLLLRVDDPAYANREIQIDFEAVGNDLSRRLDIKKGDQLVLSRSVVDGEENWMVFEPYRINSLLFLALLFVLLVLLVSGWRGFWSLFSLFVTLFILVKGILPLIVAGYNPVFVSFAGSFLVAGIALYLAHGFKKRTSLALAGTLITLLLAFILSIIAVSSVQLFGMGSEDAASLAFSNLSYIDIRGLLLGAIVIGTLGILDDVTTAQVATVYEIYETDRRLGFSSLYKKGLSVGREHIASMVNTLLVAYVGAAFPVLLLILSSSRPFWVVANNEFLAEEIVRTLVGSMTLVAAVPITTFIAAYYYGKIKMK